MRGVVDRLIDSCEFVIVDWRSGDFAMRVEAVVGVRLAFVGRIGLGEQPRHRLPAKNEGI